MIRKKLVTLGLVGVMATSIAINNVTLVKAETLKANKNIIKSSSLTKNSDENKELDRAKRKARNHAENLLSMAEELYVKGNNDSIIKELMDSAKEKIDILHRLGGNTTEIIKQFENLDKKINKSIMRKPVNKENKKNEENIKELLKNTKNFILEKKLAEANSRILLATHYINKAEKEYGMDVSEFKKDIINLKSDNDKLYWELSKQNVKLKDEIYGDISKIDELLRNKEVDKCKELYENVKNKVKNFKYEDSTNATEYVKKIKNKLKTKKQDIDKIAEELTRENKVVAPVKELVVQEKEDNKKNEENIKELLKNTKKFISEKKLAEANSRILLATHYINKAEKEYGMDVSEFKKDIINLKIDNDKLYWELSKQNVKLKNEIYEDISKIDELLRNKEVDKCKELYENIKNKVKNFKYEDSTNATEYVKKIKNKLKTKKQDIDKIAEELTRENKVVVPVKELVVQDKKEIVPVKELVIQDKKEIVPVKELVLQDKEEIVPVKELVLQDKEEIVPVKELVLQDKKEIVPVKEVIVKEKEDIATSSKVVKDRDVNNLIERNIPIKVTKFNKDEKNELVFRKNSITKQVNKSIETINRVNENKESERIETNSQVKVEENNLDNIKTKNDKEQPSISSEKKDQIELMKTEKSSISKGLIAGIIGTIVAIGAGIVLFLRKKF